jgi:pimeloyl-ACP methyl ester carboxylesterase
MNSTFAPQHRGGSGTPIVCLHGFTDTWRTWELVLPKLEQRHQVLAPTLAGHAGGARLAEPIAHDALVDAAERAMDEAGFETAHIVGNSLGGFISLQLAARGRALSVVALAPAGGWATDSPLVDRALDHFVEQQQLVRGAAPYADRIVASTEGRRRASAFITERYEHLPAELLAHQIRGAAACEAALPLIEYVRHEGYQLAADQITCPVRIAWGTADRLLPWPDAAVRYREEWLPNADWVVLEGVGHCPQLDVPADTAELILGFTGS